MISGRPYNFFTLSNIPCDILELYIFLSEMANKDNVKSLRKDNDELKKAGARVNEGF